MWLQLEFCCISTTRLLNCAQHSHDRITGRAGGQTASTTGATVQQRTLPPDLWKKRARKPVVTSIATATVAVGLSSSQVETKNVAESLAEKKIKTERTGESESLDVLLSSLRSRPQQTQKPLLSLTARNETQTIEENAPAFKKLKPSSHASTRITENINDPAQAQNQTKTTRPLTLSLPSPLPSIDSSDSDSEVGIKGASSQVSKKAKKRNTSTIAGTNSCSSGNGSSSGRNEGKKYLYSRYNLNLYERFVLEEVLGWWHFQVPVPARVSVLHVLAASFPSHSCLAAHPLVPCTLITMYVLLLASSTH